MYFACHHSFFHIIPAALFVFNPMLTGSGDGKSRVKAQNIHSALWKIPTLDFLASFIKTKGKVRMKHDTGQHVLQLGSEITRFWLNTYLCPFASSLAALQNGTVWPRSFSTPLPWLAYPVGYLSFTWVPLLTLPVANGKKESSCSLVTQCLSNSWHIILVYACNTWHSLLIISPSTHIRLYQV